MSSQRYGCKVIRTCVCGSDNVTTSRARQWALRSSARRGGVRTGGLAPEGAGSTAFAAGVETPGRRLELRGDGGDIAVKSRFRHCRRATVAPIGFTLVGATARAAVLLSQTTGAASLVVD